MITGYRVFGKPAFDVWMSMLRCMYVIPVIFRLSVYIRMYDTRDVRKAFKEVLVTHASI